MRTADQVYRYANNPVARKGYKMFRDWLNKSGKRPRTNGEQRPYGRANKRARVSSGRGITAQHDVSRIYNKRYMPRRKKRVWKRFVRKVHSVNQKLLGTRSIIMNSQILPDAPAVAFQNYATFCLYGLRGNNGLADTPNGYSDLKRIVTADTSIPTTGKVLFKSAVLDATFTNDGENPLELDIYELSFSKDKHGYYDVDSAIVDAENTVPDITNALTLKSRGATLFEFPQAISNLGMKILKKTKYFLSSRQSCTYQIRDPKNHVLEKMQLTDDSFPNSFAWKGKTRVICAVFKGTPNTGGASLAIGVTRKYSYCVLEQTGDKEGYNL